MLDSYGRCLAGWEASVRFLHPDADPSARLVSGPPPIGTWPIGDPVEIVDPQKQSVLGRWFVPFGQRRDADAEKEDVAGARGLGILAQEPPAISTGCVVLRPADLDELLERLAAPDDPPDDPVVSLHVTGVRFRAAQLSGVRFPVDVLAHERELSPALLSLNDLLPWMDSPRDENPEARFTSLAAEHRLAAGQLMELATSALDRAASSGFSGARRFTGDELTEILQALENDE